MENRIEEDIKNAEHFIKTIKTDIKYVEENCWHVYYDKEIVELARILQNILSDYKRVLEEANRYKNMYEAEHEIHLVRNEQLDRKENAITMCKELENENKTIKEANNYWKSRYCEISNNSIQILKVKDKIEKFVKKRTKELKKYAKRENELVYDDIILNLIERLQKENEELRKELNEENKICMILATEKQDYFEKYKYHLQQNESLTRECSNGILIKKIKDKIEYLERETNGECIGFLKGLQELLESE